jgi:hypothetical protein
MSITGPGNRTDGDNRPTDPREPAEAAVDNAAPRSVADDRTRSGAATPPGVPPGVSRDASTQPDAVSSEESGQRASDSSAWRRPPTPDQPPGYSGQFPVQEPAPYGRDYPMPPSDPRTSGQFPTSPPDAGQYRSGAMPQQRDPRTSGPLPTSPQDDVAYRHSGAFPTPADDPYRSGPLPAQRDATRSGAVPTQSGQWDAYRSGPQQTVPPASPYLTTRTGSFTPVVAPGAAVRDTGSRRAVAAPGVGSMLADRAALAFIGVAVLLVGAMVAYIAIRYSHFPAQIAMHFGPAGPTAPDRIGDKRELWTIPFIAGIVLAANAALAWALYHYDRFAARLLTLGGALVGAISWVVLMTLLHR